MRNGKYFSLITNLTVKLPQVVLMRLTDQTGVDTHLK
jgi:hypothetical protein